MPDFGGYQNEIYLAGLSGRLPRFPMRFDELEAKAHRAMAESLVSYVAGGCGDEQTRPMSPRSTNGASCRGCSSAPSSVTFRSSSPA